jgi:hypothetical protein
MKGVAVVVSVMVPGYKAAGTPLYPDQLMA